MNSWNDTPTEQIEIWVGLAERGTIKFNAENSKLYSEAIRELSNRKAGN